MARKWTAADIPPLGDRIAVVTGANRGLGREIAAALAAAGATVVLACRDIERARRLVAELTARTPQLRLDAMELDLADLGSVRSFAQAYASRYPRLDLLCHNAGAIMLPQHKSRDGFEMHMAVNHFGPFALTGLLLPSLRASPKGARVLAMSSMSHRMTSGLHLDDIQLDRTPYKIMDAYGRSKLAALMFSFELDRRLRKAGLPILSVAAHPGYARTNPDLGSFLLRLMTRLIAQPPAMGALPALYALCADGVQGGEFYGPGGPKELRGYPVKVDCSQAARDQLAAARLWTMSEQLTGVRYLGG